MDDVLTSVERAQLQALCTRDSLARETWAQVDRILASPFFSRLQPRAHAFLRWVVAQTLLGHEDQIKEVSVAIAVFGESSDFDPAVSSKVRVAAGDLRQRLKHYAEHHDEDDPIEIRLSPHSYVPVIRDRRPVVSIVAFDDWHSGPGHDHMRLVLAAEIGLMLEQAGFRVAFVSAPGLLGNAKQYVLRGNVNSDDRRVRMSLSVLQGATGTIVCSPHFEGHRFSALKLARDAAETLLAAIADFESAARLPVPARKRVEP